MLKVKFVRYKNVVIMEVLEQGNEFKKGCGVFFKASNGIIFQSQEFLQIQSDFLFFLGRNERTSTSTCREFDTESKAKEQLSKYVQAIEEYNRSLDKPVDAPDDEIEVKVVG